MSLKATGPVCWFPGLLAELEAATQGPESGLKLIDELRAEIRAGMAAG